MVDLFKRLKNLSKDQTQAIKTENLEFLAEIIQQKQNIIEKINKFKGRRGYDQLMDSENKEIAAIIEEQLALDKENQNSLSTLIAQLRNKQAKVTKGKAAAKSYSQKNSADPRFFDIAG